MPKEVSSLKNWWTETKKDYLEWREREARRKHLLSREQKIAPKDWVDKPLPPEKKIDSAPSPVEYFMTKARPDRTWMGDGISSDFKMPNLPISTISVCGDPNCHCSQDPHNAVPFVKPPSFHLKEGFEAMKKQFSILNNFKNPRPSWDIVWMDFAFNVARRSCDPKHKVACVIVTEDNSLSWQGYNGDEAGGPNRRDSLETSKSGLVHSEVNALLKFDYSDTRPKKMYLTISPCRVCARAIVNAKTIREVIYAEEYTEDSEGLKILRARGIKVRKLPRKEI